MTSELALRQYIAGGFEKVYEMGYYFRNGNTDAKHLTPFLAAEIYTAFAEERQNIQLMQELFRSMVSDVRPLVESYGLQVPGSFLDEIPVCTFDEFFARKTGISYLNGDQAEIYGILGIEGTVSHEELVKEIYKFLKQKAAQRRERSPDPDRSSVRNQPADSEKSDRTLYRSYLIVNGATLMESAVGRRIRTA